jgi:hypothetical protein
MIARGTSSTGAHGLMTQTSEYAVLYCSGVFMGFGVQGLAIARIDLINQGKWFDHPDK